MMKRLLLAIACLLAMALPAMAQQTQSLSWDFLGLTPAEVMIGQQAITFNGTAIATAPTCVAKTTAPTGTTCTVPLPAFQTTNTAAVAFTRNGVTATTTVNGITAVAAVSASGPRLTIHVTINLGS